MTNFSDLATELVLAIAFYVPKSSDKLHLALVNREMHQMINPIRYKCIMLGQSRDPSNRGNSRWMHGKSCWDTVRLRKLSSALKTDAPFHKSVVESLNLELDSKTLYKSFESSDIMLYLPSLKSFCLSTKRSAEHKFEQNVSPSEIGRRLRGVSLTLQSLIIDIDQSLNFRDGSGIGSFHDFVALKYLSIQSHILIGDCGDGFYIQGADGRPLGFDLTLLAKTLPLGLQHFQISCWTDGRGDRDTPWTFLIALLLEKLMKAGLDTLSELQSITVYYPASDQGPSDYGDIALDEAFWMGDDKPVCIRYVYEGLWQTLAEEFERMAWRKHRRVSVRYEQGSQIGSRYWGETATESSNTGRWAEHVVHA